MKKGGEMIKIATAALTGILVVAPALLAAALVSGYLAPVPH
jgi:hypothetical protein